MKQLTDLIPTALKILGLCPDQVVIPTTQYNKIAVTAEEFVTATLLIRDPVGKREHLSVSQLSINRANKLVFPVGTGNQPKKLVILSLLGLKQCTLCGIIDMPTQFSKSKNNCLDCGKKKGKEYCDTHKDDPEYKAKNVARSRKYYSENKEQKAASGKKYYAANKEQKAAYGKEYYQNNKEAICKRTNARATSPEGRPGKTAASARYRAAKLNRTPVWSELDLIKEFYRNCPVGSEVDHVLPLQGKLVSGLHVIDNLQYLTVAENRSKSNKFEIK